METYPKVFSSEFFSQLLIIPNYLSCHQQPLNPTGAQLNIITIELLVEIKSRYRLNWSGIHGISHWSRVYENGVKLSDQSGVNSKVVQLFSIFHDSQRRNESIDPNHGKRGSQLALELRDHLPIDNTELQLLETACSFHTSADNHHNMTVQACFDSDRLDLGRVGKYPDPALLCTPLAKEKETIEWAYHRSVSDNKRPERPFGIDASDCLDVEVIWRK